MKTRLGKFALKFSTPLVIVGALFLASCGDSSDPPPEDPPPPVETGPASVEQLSLNILNAGIKADAANTSAEDALKSATESGAKLLTDEVGGDSSAAMMAAQAIVDAARDIGTALTDANDALTAAKAARTEVMALADDHPEKATLMTTVDAVIEDAEGFVDAIKAINDGTDLEDLVAEVEGTDGMGTPRSIANAVGEAIATALELNATNTGGLGRGVGTHGTAAPAGTIAASHKVVMDDAKGHTWEEIVEYRGGMVVTKPIGTDNAGLKVASIAGMETTKVWATLPEAELETIDDGEDFENANYMGIDGTVHCLGTDCKVTDGKLVGSWYFAQTDAATTHYVRNPDSVLGRTTPYVDETLYATYGHWLDVAEDGAATVNTFATTGGDATGSGVALGAASALADVDDGDKATYKGGAVGMSVLKTGTGDDQTTDSGRFTAAVELNATFDATTPTVRGTINNFEGDATNPTWSVTLETATLSGASPETGVAVTNGRDGTWNAQAYGNDVAKRPTGIFGGFSVHFEDGDAAGAYATRDE